MQSILPSWPVRDEEGRPDMITIPEIQIHARFKVTCIVSIITHPEIEPFVYHLSGAENIHDIEDRMLESILRLEAEEVRKLPKLEDMKITFISSENLALDKNLSIWRVAEDTCEDFNPSSSVCYLVVTLDPYEEFIMGRPFDNFIMLTIMANTFFLAADHFEANDAWVVAQDIAEWLFNVVFFAEMCAKIFCLKGVINYLTPHANKFDFMIVLSSVVQIIVNASMSSEEADKLSVLKLFRLFRAFRVARLLRRFESVKMIVDSALGSLQPIFNIMMFMMLMIIVYGCLGMQLYGSQMNFMEDGELARPRHNFDDFINALFSLFQVIYAI